MTQRLQVSVAVAKATGDHLGLDWAKVDLQEFRSGLEMELEHSARDSETIVAGDVLVLTGKVTRAHLREYPDYYSRLEELEYHAVA